MTTRPQSLPLALVCGIAVLLTACGPSTVPAASEPDPNAPTLADVRESLAEPTETPSTGEAVLIDPAAKNINPFKTLYLSSDREVFEQILVEARKDSDYLRRSLAATEPDLEALMLGFSLDMYEYVLTCAASGDAFAKAGERPAHIAQQELTAYIKEVLVDALKNPEHEAAGAKRRAMRQAVRDFQRRTYVNYHLIRDEIIAGLREPDIFDTPSGSCAPFPPSE